MTWSNTSARWLVLCGLLLASLAVGCSTREDPNEVLPLAGNHSPGDLVMVTTDTSSAGYHYLEPELSPDGTRIVFTADWAALKPDGVRPDTDPTIRQLLVMPYRVGSRAEQSIAQANATLVPFPTTVAIVFGHTRWNLNPQTVSQKGSPTWLDDETILFWMHTERGDRLFTADLTESAVQPQLVYYEPEDDQLGGRNWFHHDPAISPDGEWVAFTRFCGSRSHPDSVLSYSKQSLWALSLNRTPQILRRLTTGVTLLGSPAWAPDGQRIAFHATLDIAGGGSFYGTEIFSITFDGAQAAADTFPANQGLRRLTYTSIPEGNPIPIQNREPSFSADGGTLVFTSTRRAPTITLHDRSIWRIPSDGRLEPQIAFFSREDDVNAQFLRGSSNTLILSSAMGFPTEMLDRLEGEARLAIAADDSTLNDVQVNELAAAQRMQLEYFAQVMSHIFVFRGW